MIFDITIMELYDKINHIETTREPYDPAFIFNYIKDRSNFSWLTNSSVVDLNNSYVNFWSGDKLVSQVFYNFYNRLHKQFPQLNEVELCIGSLEMVSGVIVNRFTEKWNRLYKAMVTDTYNALNNYNVVDSRSDDNYKKTSKETDMDTEVDNQTNTFGFNTLDEDGVPSDKSHSKQNVSGDKDKNYVEQEESKNKVSTRVGLTGEITSQKLLEQELEVRKTNFFDIVFKDIDTILTNRIYRL